MIYDSLSGGKYFMASSYDGGVREYDMERFQLMNHFRCSWPVNFLHRISEGEASQTTILIHVSTGIEEKKMDWAVRLKVAIGVSIRVHLASGQVYTQEEVDNMFVAECRKTQSQFEYILQGLNSKGIPISLPDILTTCSQPNTTEEEIPEGTQEEEEGDENDDVEL